MEAEGDARDADETLAELVTSLARRMRREWRAAGGADGGPPPAEARALTIVMHRDGVRPGALAHRLRISPRSATDVVDALEARGLVAREADPSDRRACLVRPTPRGRVAFAALRRDRHARADALFSVLTPDERATLESLLRRVVDQPGDAPAPP
ncbi:MAG: MarR family transcriptional regulator [Thermoleophilia bacterium]|nr:MarR family transcriptional regulator [Thermoleophilia bacterium]